MATENAPPNMSPLKDPNRKEVLIVAMIDLVMSQTKMSLFEMRRDSNGQLFELATMDTGDKDEEVRAYLLEKFIEGYQNAKAHR